MTTPTIIEVTGRSKQGMTRPFMCRADDGNFYYVKGRYAGMRSLVCEWLAGTLAKAFCLPIAPFSQLNVPTELIEQGIASGESLTELGSGLVFGSQQCDLSEITMTSADLVSGQQKADVAVFDWWVHNEDRTLSEKGGNPNLFWDAGRARLWAIDHNLAFDESFSPPRFLETHIFRDTFRNTASDFIARKEYAERLSNALAAWHAARDALPQMWHYADLEQTIPLGFDFEGVYARLARCAADEFWNLK